MSDSITITGNITEPELRHLPSGIAVLNFKIGSSHRMFDKSQQKWVETSTSWYSVSAFRALGEHAAASLHRGDRVVVHGRLKLREWENGSGSRGFAAEIEADSLGHDLMFGTSTFTKADGRTADGASAADAWAPAEASSSQATSEDPDREPELALVGAAVDGGDSPF